MLSFVLNAGHFTSQHGSMKVGYGLTSSHTAYLVLIVSKPIKTCSHRAR